MTIAGSETTATLLSGCTYYLCQNPGALRKVTKEIRDAFPHAQDIQARECAKQSYLNAIIKESLRLYPPLVTNLPRITPLGGCMIDRQFVPENVDLFLLHMIRVLCHVDHEPGDSIHAPLRLLPRIIKLRAPSRVHT